MNNGQHVFYVPASRENREKIERKLFPKGRKCCQEGCVTILNIYNSGPECILHSRSWRDENEKLMRRARELGLAPERR